MKLKTPDGFILDARISKVSPKKIVILLHGLTANKDEESVFVKVESKLYSKNISTINFDLRCHGQSTGISEDDFDIPGSLKDFNFITDYIKNQNYTNVGLASASFMGGVVTDFLKKNPKYFSCVLLLNPVLNFKNFFIKLNTNWSKKYFRDYKEKFQTHKFIEVGSRKYKLGKSFFRNIGDFDPCNNLQKYTNPLMIIHGNCDNVVSYQDTNICFNSQPSKKKEFVTIKGADHGFHLEPYLSETVSYIEDFFLKYL